MNVKLMLTILFMVIITSLAILFRAHNQIVILQGEVDAPQVIVTSKAKGRVVERFVDRGYDVQKGTPLLRLESPELIAQVKALEAARDSAKAKLAESLHGTREESIRKAKAELAEAQATYTNAVSTYNRNKKLAERGFLSKLALDNYQRDKDTALQSVKAAKAALDLAEHGDRSEQIAQYEAALRQAEQNLEVIKAQSDELTVLSPVDGEIGSIPAEVGELLNASTPLMTVVRLPQAYFIFNLREDILAKIHKNDIVEVTIPALNNQKVKTRVGYIAPLGDFSTKRATRATGDFDLKVFEVRLYLDKPIKDLRLGMSVLWDWEK